MSPGTGTLVTPLLVCGWGSVFGVLLVTPTLVIGLSLASLGLFVTPPLVIRVRLALGLLVGDSSCVHGESALTSAGASASDPI